MGRGPRHRLDAQPFPTAPGLGEPPSLCPGALAPACGLPLGFCCVRWCFPDVLPHPSRVRQEGYPGLLGPSLPGPRALAFLSSHASFQNGVLCWGAGNLRLPHVPESRSSTLVLHIIYLILSLYN